MSRRAIGTGLLAACLAATSAHAAGEAAGTTTASFLSVGAGASVLAMSGASLASGRDLAAASWNPAALTGVDALQFSLSHAPLPGGATQDWLSAGGRVAGGDTHWALHALFQQEGAIEGRDAANQPTGSLSASDLALGGSLARRIGSFASAGAGVQWLHESLTGTSGSAVAFDLGLKAEAGAFGFAIAARHLGSAMRYADFSYALPAVLAVGGSWSDPARGLRFAADLENPSHYYQAVRLGGEWLWRDRVALRLGYREQLGVPAAEQLSGASFGMGAGAGSVWLDYAFTPDGAEGAGQHRMSVTFRPGLPSAGGSATHLRTNASPAEPPVTRPARQPIPRTVRAKTPVVEASKAPSGEASKAAAGEASKAAAGGASRAAAGGASGGAGVVPPSPPPAAGGAASAPPSAPAPAKAPAPAAPVPAPAKDPTPSPSASEVRPGADAPRVPAEPVRPASRPAWIVVGPGETLASLAKRWETTVAALMMENNLVREKVAPGTRLKLPAKPR